MFLKLKNQQRVKNVYSLSFLFYWIKISSIVGLAVFISQAFAQTPIDAFKEKARNGDVSAMNMLGNLYRSGSGGAPKEILTAFDWYQKAAAAGSGPAHFNLGNIYERGELRNGVDKVKAKEHFETALSLGFKRAEEGLARLAQREQGLTVPMVAQRLSEIQISKCRTYAANFFNLGIASSNKTQEASGKNMLDTWNALAIAKFSSLIAADQFDKTNIEAKTYSENFLNNARSRDFLRNGWESCSNAYDLATM